MIISRIEFQYIPKSFMWCKLILIYMIFYTFKPKRKVWWEVDGKDFNGVPFMILGTKRLDCHHGQDRNANIKKIRKEQKEMVN